MSIELAKRNMPTEELGAHCSAAHDAYLRERRQLDRLIGISRAAILLLVVVCWEISTRAGWLDAFIVSSPTRILATLMQLARDGSLLLHIAVTLGETIVGFALGTGVGTLIALLLWCFPTASRTLDPYLVVLNALPKIALGPVLIVWLGAGVQTIVAIAVLISVIVTITSVLNGFNEVSEEKIRLMQSLGASKMQILRLLILPSNIPTIVATLKLNVGMSWVGVIVGEFLVSRAGLGYLAVYGGQVFKLDLVMTSVVILCALAALMYYGVAWFEKRITRRVS